MRPRSTKSKTEIGAICFAPFDGMVDPDGPDTLGVDEGALGGVEDGESEGELEGLLEGESEGEPKEGASGDATSAGLGMLGPGDVTSTGLASGEAADSSNWQGDQAVVHIGVTISAVAWFAKLKDEDVTNMVSMRRKLF